MNAYRFLLRLTALVLLLCTVLAACGGKGKSADISGVSEDGVSSEDTDGKKKTTLMVYMVGSDLEAKTAAGTNDLDEMKASGVDLTSTNVVVYTGGAPKWHNDLVTKEEHAVLNLTDDGFVSEKTAPAASMGEPDNLSSFINHAYSTYPAEEYALIMWDHGNGPIIGYGKDMLYDNDTLTLKEMQTAMAATPFNKDNKLKWVGFDACLMASAELACVWAEYADYLVASQEVEPSFGWNYGFLGNISTQSTTELLGGITKGYLESCEAYYKKKGYTDRDTTLACYDLSKTDALTTALANLFTKAKDNIGTQYNALTAKRVSTRALGRASTGSEYDLIDLNDMAAQLLDLFPTEATALSSAIKDMVIANATNTTGCCGMSLYYPFYNKPYYEKDWGKAYTDLGLLPEYLAYLQAYAATWLKDDMLTDIAKSQLPSSAGENTYKLSLTDEQADVYASARYYILEKEGNGLYNPLFASYNIKKQGNDLIASFDGDVIYAKDKFNRYFIPVSQERDTVGDITRYSVYAGVNNWVADTINTPKEYQPEYKNAKLDFHLAINNKTKSIALSAITPRDTDTAVDELMGGKLEDMDLSEYSTYIFPQERHIYLDRFENGAVCPLSQWAASDYYSRYEVAIGDGVEFVFAPLVAGEYYLIYEIQDTQGNSYCSEMLPITEDGVLEQEITPDPVEKTWANGDSPLALGTFGGVDVSMEVYTTAYNGDRYTLTCKNNNDFPVFVSTDNVFVNDTIYCETAGTGYFAYIKAGETATYKYGMSFDAAESFIASLDTLQFTLRIKHAEKRNTLVNDQPIYVTLPNATVDLNHYIKPSSYSAPVYGILANEQVLYTDDEIKVTLLGMGGEQSEFEGSNSIYGAIKIENFGTQKRVLALHSLSLDGISLPLSAATLTVYPGSTVYSTLRVGEDDISACGITSASSAKLLMRFMKFATLEGGGGFSTFKWCNVSLAQRGAKATFVKGGKVLYNENGIKLALVGRKDTYTGGYSWSLAVTNTSGTDCSIEVCDATINGTLYPNTTCEDLGTNNQSICNGEKAVIELNYFGDASKVTDLSCRIRLMDLAMETVIYTGDSYITLISGGAPIE